MTQAEKKQHKLPDDYRKEKNRPFTGEEYLASLRDGRKVYIYGELVDDVTTHPAFRNAAASVAKLYDALHDPATKDELCWETDTGNGGYTHKNSARFTPFNSKCTAKISVTYLTALVK
ncbi:TPA: 4-hydroxyphenylacetate 3-hydroxylase N-terminal domain-containing protein [Pasteurella multocida]|uniref:4-hydroxyphenylacetate 3-hydroxylase N-terminal domain-containing protein n=1 Tax=Pasteurella multocida TaxID=747 RepID=UPI00403DF2E8